MGQVICSAQWLLFFFPFKDGEMPVKSSQLEQAADRGGGIDAPIERMEEGPLKEARERPQYTMELLGPLVAALVGIGGWGLRWTAEAVIVVFG
jgi:hypothetical protein